MSDVKQVFQDLSGLSEQEARYAKLQAMQEQGIPQWRGPLPINATMQEVVDQFGTASVTKEYTVAGRVISLRLHGKTAFLHIQDRSAKLQLYIREKDVGIELFEWFKHYIDVGDIIWVRGTVFKTKMGEITLTIAELVLLSKCLHALPDKFHGLTDIETIYRQRYLDLISNPDSRKRFKVRAEIVKAIRSVFEVYDFLEVETPMLHPIPGGAVARPFITHHNALDSDLYLRIAPELYLKRLVVGGFERVFEINRNFRNEGISTVHNPEFTMVEWYMAHHDYRFMMTFVENMLRIVVYKVCSALQVPYGGYTIDFEPSFTQLSVKDALLSYTDYTKHDLSLECIDGVLEKHGITIVGEQVSLGQKLYALFEVLVEHQLIQPTFITHFPIEVSPLSKRDEDDPSVAARFELFIGGMEIANGFNELNDPFDQSNRFKQQVQARQAGDQEAHYYDADYIRALEYAMPPTVGVGMGVDRLVMLLTNTVSIKDVILFPTLKRKTE